jgi:hypothetical protein
MATQRFTAKLFKDDDTSGCGVELPFDPKEAFGRVRTPVKVTINGFTFRTTICAMGGAYWIPVNRANRDGAGIAAGDKIAVAIQPDTMPRVVKPPADFVQALRAAPPAYPAWQKLSYSHQKEYVVAIEEAKKPETRARRIAKAVETLRRVKQA